MNYILVGLNGRPSIRVTSQQISEEHVCLMRRKYKNNNIQWTILVNDKWVNYLPLNQNPSFTNQDTVIRWGFSGQLNFNGARIIQRGEAIDLISNKFGSRLKFEQSNIPVPKTAHDLSQAVEMLPVIVRPNYHSRGKNFYVVNSRDELYNILDNKDLKNGYYCSEIYNKQREVRVHVAYGKVLLVQEKEIVPGIIQANRAQTHADWKVIPWGDYEKDVCKIACDAVKAVNGDIGGVDIMIDRRNTTMPVCICEINSAPTIKSAEYTIQRYAKFFSWIFRNKDAKWWNYEKYNIGSSFSWKNNQLES